MPQHKKGLRRRNPRKHRGGKHRKTSALPNNRLKITETIGGNRLIAPQQPYCVWNTLYDSYRAKLTFAHAGGMWLAGPELLATLAACAAPTSVILDLYDTPVKIDSREFRDIVRGRWQEQMNAWLVEHEEQSKNR